MVVKNYSFCGPELWIFNCFLIVFSRLFQFFTSFTSLSKKTLLHLVDFEKTVYPNAPQISSALSSVNPSNPVLSEAMLAHAITHLKDYEPLWDLWFFFPSFWYRFLSCLFRKPFCSFELTDGFHWVNPLYLFDMVNVLHLEHEGSKFRQRGTYQGQCGLTVLPKDSLAHEQTCSNDSLFQLHVVYWLHAHRNSFKGHTLFHRLLPEYWMKK